MRNIKPFNEVWLNCYNNLKLSLLTSVDKEWDIYGYENQYEYFLGQEISGGGTRFNYLTVEQKVFDYELFAKVEQKDFVNEDEFKRCIIEQLNSERGYVLIRVDLHDWLEGSISWKKFHWDHYSLLASIDFNNQMVTAFDELQGQYSKFEVDINDLFRHLSNNSKFSQLKLITLNDEIVLPQIDEKKYVLNAQRVVSSIDSLINTNFWMLSDNDFRARSHMEVNGVYLQRIEGRQEANQKFIETILANADRDNADKLKVIRNGFITLIDVWRSLRMELFKVYFDDRNRQRLLTNLNSSIMLALQDESKLWKKFLSIFENN